MQRSKRIANWLVAAGVAVSLAAAGCASSKQPAAKQPDKLTQELLTQPKEVLFEKGKALLEKKKYDDARKYLNHVFET